MSIAIYIPLAREYRLLPLQVSLCQKHIADISRIVVIQTPPGKSWITSGGPWQLRKDVAKRLGVDVVDGPSHCIGITPHARIHATFHWLADSFLPGQPESHALVLSGDVLPTGPIDVPSMCAASGGACRKPWEFHTWFATTKDRQSWTEFPAKWRADRMEDCEPGFLHADKLTSCGDFAENKIPILEAMFATKIPSHDEVRETLSTFPGFSFTRTTPSTTGDRLHDLILQWTGYDYKPGCGCQAVVAMMNSHPPEWSITNMDMIVDKLRDAASNRGWLAKLAAGIPGVERPLSWLVLHAVKSAKSDLDAKQASVV